jgi:hypothetical protein
MKYILLIALISTTIFCSRSKRPKPMAYLDAHGFMFFELNQFRR